MLITIIIKTKKEQIEIEEVNKIKSYFISLGLSVKEYINDNLNIINFDVNSDEDIVIDKEFLLKNPIVQNVFINTSPYFLASREYKKEDSVIQINDNIKIGGKNIVIIGGPCAIESENQINEIASNVKESGAVILRGGAYKMRTSPYSFQGLGKEGIDLLYSCGKKLGLPVISEITNINQIDEFIKKVDIIQVGARNMLNYELLKALGKTNKTILLKRGMGSTIEEWLMSAEYILSNGNFNVILCERGIRTFEKMTRYTLDLSSVVLIKKISHLPIIVDPSHACGQANLVTDLALASIACGADGLLLEVHNNPKESLSDSKETISTNEFKHLVTKVKSVAKAIERDVL